MILEAKTHIRADPEDVFAFFEDMERQYEAWHPAHITFRWVEGQGLEEGHLAYFEEEIAGERLEKTVQFTRIARNRHIEMRPTSRLLKLFLPFITFTIEPEDGGCRMTQRIKIRTGPIGKWLNRREFAAVTQHMEEEGANLKQILEETREE